MSADKRLVLKLYSHRGLWHAFRCWITRYRVEREYDSLSHLVLCGVPCTAPSDWTHGYSSRYGFYELLATVMVPEAIDLQAHLNHGRPCDFRLLFSTVRRLHESGCCHHALFSRNVLISPNVAGSDSFTICDVARSRIFPNSIVGTRLALLDLADLAHDLMRHGVLREAIPYDAYGLR